MNAGARRLVPAVLLLLAGTVEAFAQGRPEDEQRGVTVLNRERPEYDPLGIRVGAFTIRGTAQLDQAYNDNVFYSSTNKQSDSVSLMTARGSIASNWSRHGIGGYASVQRLQYWQLTDQSYTNYEAGLNGRYDLTPDTELTGEASSAVYHVLRTDPDSQPSDEPIEYSVQSFGAGVAQSLSRYRLGLRGFYRVYDYDAYSFDGVQVRGSGQFNDYEIYGATATVGYALGPFRTVFAGLRVFRLRYTDVPTGFLDLSSNAVYGFVGFNYDFDGVWRYEFDVGYINQVYDEDSIQSLSGPSGSLRVTWAPTSLLAIRANLARSIRQQLVQTGTAADFENGFFSNEFGVNATYELYRNVLVNAGISGRYDEYRGTRGSSWYLAPTVGVNVLLDRNFRVGAYYLRQDTLNENGGDPSRNVIAFRLTAEL
ncbi:outer membrane beta-barrel protein [Elioraea rosea]|uniref:outer membrane beta-barrel protein n=1 Tax=Elioraea rosea TaxID=2492390 RepID=UPI001315836F|nr:outer membrane beta-barrel protein [Elioraea rosea]